MAQPELTGAVQAVAGPTSKMTRFRVNGLASTASESQLHAPLIKDDGNVSKAQSQVAVRSIAFDGDRW